METENMEKQIDELKNQVAALDKKIPETKFP